MGGEERAEDPLFAMRLIYQKSLVLYPYILYDITHTRICARFLTTMEAFRSSFYALSCVIQLSDVDTFDMSFKIVQ